MASATFLRHTQSARKGDKMEYDAKVQRHQQLLRNGVIKLDEVVQEVKPVAPEENKVTAPEETKRKRRPKSKEA